MGHPQVMPRQDQCLVGRGLFLAQQAGHGLAAAGDHHLVAAFHRIQQSRQLDGRLF